MEKPHEAAYPGRVPALLAQAVESTSNKVPGLQAIFLVLFAIVFTVVGLVAVYIAWTTMWSDRWKERRRMSQIT